MQTKTIPIVLSSDDNYAKYISVVLESIHTYSNKDYLYDIYVMDSGISEESIYAIDNSAEHYSNIKINYILVDDLIEKFKDIFVTFAHFSPATYSRFFIPLFLRHLKKILYLDIDLCVKGDLSELYNIDMNNYIVAAAVDGKYAIQLYNDENGLIKYTEEVIGLPKNISEFNAGVLLINIEKWEEEDITDKCLAKLKEIGVPRVLDQCVLNAVIEQKYIYKLPCCWNYVWHAKFDDFEPTTDSKEFNETIIDYRNNLKNIKIIHYTTGIKPWNMFKNNKEDLETVISYLADDWWHLASKTKVYTKILRENLPINTVVMPVSEPIPTLTPSAQMHESNKAILTYIKRYYFLNLRLFKTELSQDTKRYYFLNLRLFKVNFKKNIKKYYFLNLRLFKIEYPQKC